MKKLYIHKGILYKGKLMFISKMARFVATKTINPLGFYTKQQSVDAAINIGKELVDLSKSGKPITKELIQSTIKKQVPKANVRIVTDKNEFKQLLETAGESFEAIDSAAADYGAVYFNMGKTKGIFDPSLNCSNPNSKAIPTFAHEFEHYMYNEHTPKQSMIMKMVQKIASKKEKVKPSTPIEKFETYEHIALESDIQMDLIKYFGIENLIKTRGLKGVEPTAEGVTKLLKGKNFTGLTDDKRVDAYIRAITRRHINPKNKDSFVDLVTVKNTLDDEVRAYAVGDAVKRYMTDSENITGQGLVSEIYKRTSKVLKKEILKYLEYIGDNKTKVAKEVRTGLPTSAYVGPNPSSEAASLDSMNKVLEQKINGEHKTIKVKGWFKAQST